ncbi:MAG: hypothetical protein IJ105_00785 [Bacilli bacterium]|nr:hypothetical protein [Bacilli bacterium]
MDRTKGKRYDFKKNCTDRKTAEYVLNEVIKEYQNNPKWEIGKQELIDLPNGEVRVEVELTFREYETKNKMSW